MQNIVPTKIKLITVQALELSDADALAEASFNEWSKDHPDVNICQIERGSTAVLSIANPPVFHVTITIMYDLAVRDPNGVNTVFADLCVAMKAWEDWVESSNEAIRDHKQRNPTLPDMQIRLAQPFSQLLDSPNKFRIW